MALRGSREGGGSSAPGAARRAPSTSSSRLLAAVAELTEGSGGVERGRGEKAQSEGVRVPGEGVEGGTADWCRGDHLQQTQVAGTEERWTVKGTILFVVGSAKKQKYKN